jgi:Na+-transporting NADH:ubiquinone oxidoreductase subunit NqrD
MNSITTLIRQYYNYSINLITQMNQMSNGLTVLKNSVLKVYGTDKTDQLLKVLTEVVNGTGKAYNIRKIMKKY